MMTSKEIIKYCKDQTRSIKTEIKQLEREIRSDSMIINRNNYNKYNITISTIVSNAKKRIKENENKIEQLRINYDAFDKLLSSENHNYYKQNNKINNLINNNQ